MKLNRHTLTRFALAATAVLFAALLAVMFYRYLSHSPATIKQRPITVEAVEVRQARVNGWVAGEGVARAVKRRCLKFEESGKVEFVSRDADGKELREGSRVMGPSEGEKRGQELARLDSREQAHAVNQRKAELQEALMQVDVAKSALAHARNDLTLKEAEYKRMESLHNREAISDSRFDLSRNEYQNALASIHRAKSELGAAEDLANSKRAALEQDRLRLERLAIHAPFDGIVTRLNIREGEFVAHEPIDHTAEQKSLDSAAIVIVDPTLFEIVLTLPDFDGLLVREGQKAYISWPGLGEFQPLAVSSNEKDGPYAAGSVFAAAPAISPERRTVRVRIRASNETGLFHDGDFVTSWILVKEKVSALIVPNRAILYRQNKPYVFLADEQAGIARLRSIETGIEDIRSSEVTSGVEQGELVVTLGRQRLIDGSKIRIVRPDGGIR